MGNLTFEYTIYGKETQSSRQRREKTSPDLNWVLSFIGLVGWDIEADLHEGDLRVVILVELQSHLVFPSGTLGHVGKWDLKRCVFIYVKLQKRSCDRRKTRSCHGSNFSV